MIAKQHDESQLCITKKRSKLEQAIQEIDGYMISNVCKANTTNATNDFSHGITVDYKIVRSTCSSVRGRSQPSLVQSNGKIRVAPYDMSSSPFDMRYHSSLRQHIIKHGLAMLAFLESRRHVEAEESHLMILDTC